MRNDGAANPEKEERMICYGQYGNQEWYESASGDARRRAAALRKDGFRVFASSMGPQVTPVGLVKMTLLTIDNPDRREVPSVTVERMVA